MLQKAHLASLSAFANSAADMKTILREPVKNVLADFARYGGGVPPLSAKEKIFLFAPMIFT